MLRPREYYVTHEQALSDNCKDCSNPECCEEQNDGTCSKGMTHCKHGRFACSIDNMKCPDFSKWQYAKNFKSSGGIQCEVDSNDSFGKNPACKDAPSPYCPDGWCGGGEWNTNPDSRDDIRFFCDGDRGCLAYNPDSSVAVSNSFSTLSECQRTCNIIPVEDMWECDEHSGTCSISEYGTYISLKECNQQCDEPAPYGIKPGCISYPMKHD